MEYLQTVKSFGKDTMEYLGFIKRRQLGFCDGSIPITPYLLTKIFGFEVSIKSFPYWKAYFLKNCEKILGMYYNRKYRNKISDYIFSTIDSFSSEKLKEKISSVLRYVYSNFIPNEIPFKSFRDVEIIINTMMFLASMKMSWSQYLLAFPTGKKILYDAFGKRDLMSVFNLYAIIQTVYVLNQYDPILMKKEFFSILPEVGLPEELHKYLMLWIANKISILVLQKILQNYIKKKEEEEEKKKKIN